jgi:hypothetical protein
MIARWREGVVTSASNLVQLAAAIIVGIVIGKAGHLLMAEAKASAWARSEEDTGGLRPEPGRAVNAVGIDGPSRALDTAGAFEPVLFEPTAVEEQTEEADGVGAESTRQARRSRSSRRATARARGAAAAARAAAVRAAGPGPAVPCLSAQAVSALGAAAPPCQSAVATALAGVSLAGELQRAQGASPMADGALAGSDDWLGEQLAILGRAERSLLDGDPERAVRFLDEYRTRFPDGLLGPQMASVRQRVEDRFTAFIFP